MVKVNKTAWGLTATFVLVAVFWDWAFLTPVKILVVFFHEAAHGLAALATGGRIDSLIVNSNQGGLAHAYGGSRFLVLNAGYLGSFMAGAGLILAASWTRKDRILIGLLGSALGVITVLWVRNLFGFFFGLAFCGFFLAAAKYLSDHTNDFILKSVGTVSAGYAILDVWSDVFARACRSDAAMLSAEFGMPRLFWGGLWILLSLGGMYWTFRLAAKADPHR
ncbi:MAG: hypothetical protein A2X36_01295 [Elusimicrobia bacterium GWA2_69_24]|nr:MAG: hypothetical protein A2X36_01295 [Elusimicrobia bacterium GWA2_69_24]